MVEALPGRANRELREWSNNSQALFFTEYVHFEAK